MTPSSDDVEELLQAWNRGDQEAFEKLVSLVDPELRKLATAYLRREPPGHDFETTDLIDEAFVRLIQEPRIEWESRKHFFAIAAIRMRQILIDNSRRRLSAKRGGLAERVPLTKVALLPTTDEMMDEFLALNEALDRLSKVDTRKSRVVELRYFGGLTFQEIAEVLQVSLATVNRDWQVARLWLRRELQEEPRESSITNERPEIAIPVTEAHEGKLADAWSNRELIATLMSENWIGLKLLVQLRLQPDIADTELSSVLQIESSVATSLVRKLQLVGAIEKQGNILALSARGNTVLRNLENAIGKSLY
jgi:RNA polymerase sigma-70 factor, ECF subfamily